jgi:hypothetical protein
MVSRVIEAVERLSRVYQELFFNDKILFLNSRVDARRDIVFQYDIFEIV